MLKMVLFCVWNSVADLGCFILDSDTTIFHPGSEHFFIQEPT
jgi:hypothetical protein